MICCAKISVKRKQTTPPPHHHRHCAGTPTPSNSPSMVRHLQPLLVFLHHEPYGVLSSAWTDAVQRPFESQCPWGRARLMDVLRRCMIRSTCDNSAFIHVHFLVVCRVFYLDYVALADGGQTSLCAFC